jgi:hypothetical protein
MREWISASAEQISEAMLPELNHQLAEAFRYYLIMTKSGLVTPTIRRRLLCAVKAAAASLTRKPNCNERRDRLAEVLLLRLPSYALEKDTSLPLSDINALSLLDRVVRDLGGDLWNLKQGLESEVRLSRADLTCLNIIARLDVDVICPKRTTLVDPPLEQLIAIVGPVWEKVTGRSVRAHSGIHGWSSHHFGVWLIGEIEKQGAIAPSGSRILEMALGRTTRVLQSNANSSNSHSV